MNADEPPEGESGPKFPIVGIGASAGGLKAVGNFLDHTPVDSGMAFVLVFHLDPNHKSEAAELLQVHTKMRVTQIGASARIEPDHVYVIPPNHGLVLAAGVLQLTELQRADGRPTVIDRFFRSLAEEAGERAIGIVLSGTGSEGSQGLKAIKEAGGLAVVQDEDEAEYTGMPHSAISTGLIDFVLPVAEIPAKLLEIKDSAADFALSAEADRPPGGGDGETLQKIFVQLRSQVGHDFSQYKQNTVLRRITRRMQVHRLRDLPAYLDLLRSSPTEGQALYRELLISVTNFFRDPEAMAALARAVVPRLCGQAEEGVARVWVPGCATGEEAYSIAMLLREACDGLASPPQLQLFATDVDERALATARSGLYPGAIAGDVSDVRLKRFFERHGDGFAVKDFLREMILFTRHDLLSNPPFSKLNLISSRNLLIYLNAEVQSKIFALFHFALKAQGYLFLGTSESVGTSGNLFAEIDHKARIYQARRVPHAHMRFPLMPSATRASAKPSGAAQPEKRFEDIARNELLVRYAPPCAIVDESYNVVYIFGRVGKYLEPGTGQANYNVLDMAREGLRPELRAALYRVLHDGEDTQHKCVRLDGDGHGLAVGLSVRRLAEVDGYALVAFERVDVGTTLPERPPAEGTDDMVAQLDKELRETRESLQTTIEELETSNEELRASNEELQSMNEELQSTTEELETGKEELQSANEELLAVNQELQAKNDELARTNSDLNNFIASTEVGTLFLDEELKVRRYTPRVLEIFNLIPGDIGRPFAHLTHTLEGGGLAADVEHVLRDLVSVEKELTSTSGRRWLARLRPYRTTDNKIGGVVLTFVDISAIRQAEAAVRESEARLKAALEVADLGVVEWDLATGKTRLDDRVRERYAFRRGGSLSIDEIFARIDPEDLPGVRKAAADAAATASVFNVEFRLGGPDGAVRVVHAMATPIARADGKTERLVAAIEDVTDERAAERHLRESEQQRAFLLQFSDALRDESDPDRLTTTAVRVLARHLQVDRCYTVRCSPDTDHAWVGQEYHDASLPALIGEHHWSDFPDAFRRCDAARPLVLVDAESDASLSAGDKASFRSLRLRGVLAVLLRRGNSAQPDFWALVAGTRGPRHWSETEQRLLEDAAGRTWASFESARAKQALAKSEAHYRLLFASIDEGFCVITVLRDNEGQPVDYRFDELNPAFSRQTGVENAVGRTVKELVPEQEQYWFDIYGKVARTAEPIRFERRGEGMNRDFDLYAFRVGEPEQDRVAVLFKDITERKRVDNHRQLLIHELDHRVKNTLATVQALAMQTFRDPGMQGALEKFEARLLALSSAHGVLTRENWQGAEIQEIVQHALDAWSGDAEPRVRIGGPALRLRPEAALALAMALHELATNASKYGALSNATGTVAIEWWVTAAEPQHFRLEWCEHGGPPVRQPSRRGFGSQLVEQGLAQDLGGSVQLAFKEGGVTCVVEVPLEEVRETVRSR